MNPQTIPDRAQPGQGESPENSETIDKTGAVPVETVVDHAKRSFPVVGVGASAGGLAAFEAFFSGMPKDKNPDMAFILVQHLAPDHKSILTELVRRFTRLQVFEVKDGMKVQPNCVYIIPPNFDMAYLNGTLQLMDPTAPHGQRLPIDFFFRSLAADLHERAICIILSGAGSDGMLGLRAIKGEGGMAMAQNPDSTEYNGMPRSAIGTGLVDYELPPAEMPAQLIAYTAHVFGKPPRTTNALRQKFENTLSKVFVLLRAQTGHDFSQYKRNTIHRRIERRMAVHLIETMDAYVSYLQQTPAEVEALFHDLLIGVTNYFRDPEAFKVLEDQVIPRIFAGKPANAVIRVWSAGCSTGEEAYSLAILIAERQEAMKQSFKVQVFATDIDKAAIAVARNGVYPASIASDISAQRLTRFFTTDPNGNSYRIHKNIRDMVIFSEHNVIKDPPFSRMELISCRNLIIYFGAELQKKLFPLFHAALNPGSILFLGTSETTGEFDDLFSVLDRSSKLYQRRESFHSKQNADFTNFVPAMSAIDVSLPRAAASPLFPQKFPLRELTEQALLNQITHVSLLVNGQGKILFTHGRSGRFLELPPGEIGVSIVLTMAREGLRYELTLALQRVARTKETVRSKDLQIKTDNSLIRFNLAVSPVGTESTAPMDEFLYLVILEELPLLEITDLPANESGSTSSGTGAHITALEQELHTKEKYIQAVNEELESTNEDLKSANEEMLSVNEELQSTNEELETSKEELQSVNEELSTVNTELQNKVGDLLRVNNDMTNLLAGTGIGTIFVDHHLRIMRFTPTATHIINLISSDIGRPISHISSNLVGYDHLLTDIHSVLDTLVPVEADVQTAAGIWYAMRIHPYRTLENVIEGAVLTFVDITEMIQVRAALRESESLSRLAVVVRDAHDAITVQDLQGQILAWNPGAERIYGWSESEALKMTIHDMTPENLRAEAFGVMKRLVRAAVLEPYRMQRITKNGRIVEVWLTATALLNEAGVVYAIATTERERGLEKEV